MSVTPPAGESKIINGRGPAVLFRNHVVDFVREEGNCGRKQAVFAAVLCALDNLPAQ